MHLQKNSSTIKCYRKAASLALSALVVLAFVSFLVPQPSAAFRFLKLGEYLNGTPKQKKEDSELMGAEPADPEDTEAPGDSKPNTGKGGT